MDSGGASEIAGCFRLAIRCLLLFHRYGPHMKFPTDPAGVTTTLAPRQRSSVALQPLATITRKGAGFRSLNDTWADTTTAHGRLMLTVLGGLAEFERELIRARTGEGRARAKARGVKMGRKPKLTPYQIREAIRRRDDGDETLAEIGRSYNVSHSTISRLQV
jgi:DNA invertase Pin-like site-specific DNA recombinase